MVNEEDNNYYYQASNLSLVVIHTKDAEEPYDKEHYIDATVTIIKDNKRDTEATATIRLRGNSTSNLDKKPYRIKFNEKTKSFRNACKGQKLGFISKSLW